jgi:hypothetical protein
MVRRLCEQVANEQDPEKSKELLSLLRAVIHDDAEEIAQNVIPHETLCWGIFRCYGRRLAALPSF